MGRKKIEIERIAEDARRAVTFKKRLSGLLKKAYELSTLCGAEMAIITFDERDQLYSFGRCESERVKARV